MKFSLVFLFLTLFAAVSFAAAVNDNKFSKYKILNKYN